MAKPRDEKKREEAPGGEAAGKAAGKKDAGKGRARQRKGELPSGSVRRQVYVGSEPVLDENGKPVIDEKTGRPKVRRIYESVTAATAKDANALAAKARAARGQAHPRSRDTVKEAREKYIESRRNVLSPSSIRGYVQMSGYYWRLDPLRASDVTDADVQEWANEFSRTHSPKTVKNAYGLLKAALEAEGVRVHATLPAREAKNPYVPGDADVRAVIGYFRERGDADMVLACCLAAFATLRRSEICGLDASDLDRKTRTLHVHGSVVVDDSGESVRRGKTKTPTSDRFIELPQFVADLFPESGPAVSISPDNVTNRFGRALKKCGVPRFRFHDLRHYSASIMHAIGIPDVYIMERGGWESDDTLKRVYRGSISDYRKKFEDLTNAYFESMQHEMQHEDGET